MLGVASMLFDVGAIAFLSMSMLGVGNMLLWFILSDL